jgi:hypothetical protein
MTKIDSKSKTISEKCLKIEEQLKEQLEIISTVNKKTNNNHKTFEEVKNLIKSKINRLEQLIIHKETDDVPSYADVKVAYEKVNLYLSL